MKVLLIVSLALVLSVAAAAELGITSNYHEEIGIPEATRIKRAEEARDFDGSRIAGGQASPLGAQPHLGGLVIPLLDGRTSVCGSALLSNTKIVTAAHCWKSGALQARQFNVVLGSTTLFSGGTRLTTTHVQLHSDYNELNLNNDIAIATTTAVVFTHNIQPVGLPTGNSLYVGSWAVAAGYGRLGDLPSDDNSLKRQANLQVITNAVCTSFYGPNIVTQSTLCVSTANGQSTCSGDTGGPLTIGSGVGRQLIGVASFISSAGCSSGHPAGFARVTSFVSWIRERL